MKITKAKLWRNGDAYLIPALKYGIVKQKQLKDILETCCDFYKVPMDKVLSKSRQRNLVIVRQTYCFIAKRVTNHGTVEVGRLIKRDHATVLHSNRTFINLLETDLRFAREFRKLASAFELTPNNIEFEI